MPKMPNPNVTPKSIKNLCQLKMYLFTQFPPKAVALIFHSLL